MGKKANMSVKIIARLCSLRQNFEESGLRRELNTSWKLCL